MFILTALPLGGVVGGLLSCSDTWDDHYDKLPSGANTANGTLWQAIKQNPELSNFASVLEATGYDRSLNGSQVFTVFAPMNVNFSKSDADALIAQYKLEKPTVNEEDNTVIKEFVQNHIALYNYTVSSLSNDSIVLMNGKYAILKSDRIDNAHFNSSNKLYANGILYTVDNTIAFSANIFEAIRKDADLDSVRSFLFNPYYYKKLFDASSSVEGGIDELGRTIYLDSVFYQTNSLFSKLGRLSAEDSLYWMVAPTNEVWKKLVEEYGEYFKYHKRVENLLNGVGDLDSLIYTNTRLAILEGTAFSSTFNKAFLTGEKTTSTYADSISSVAAKRTYNRRIQDWGTEFPYYQYYDPLNTVLAEDNVIPCSNGRLMKVSDWKIDPKQTFNRWIVMECEGAMSLNSIGREYNSQIKDSFDLAKINYVSVNNPAFQSKVWNQRYAEIQATNTNFDPKITYNIKNVLSNVGYDIYLVATPATANDSNATAAEKLPTRIRCTLQYTDHENKTHKERLSSSQSTSSGNFTTTGTEVDYLLLAEDYKFPICTYGLNENETASVTLLIENRATSQQQTTMRFDCILLVPHGCLEPVDDLGPYVPAYAGQKGVMMYPFGKDSNRAYYMFR